jgi:hypothetical protein
MGADEVSPAAAAAVVVVMCGVHPLQMVRIVMDNPNGVLLNDFNSRLFAPFSAWNNRNDVIRWTSKVRA